MEIKNQTEILTRLLPVLRLYDPHVKVAGGCPRDWFMGNPCNDIDFYFSVRDPHTLIKQDIPNLAYTLGIDLKEREGTGKYNDTMDDILSVYRGEFEGISLDFIFIQSNIDTVVGQFASSICKIELDLDNMMPLPSAAFMKTMQEKVIRYSSSVSENTPHYKKMVEKFPDFKHSIPQAEKIKGYDTVAVDWNGPRLGGNTARLRRGPIDPAQAHNLRGAWRNRQVRREE